jgi:hypothetical protein
MADIATPNDEYTASSVAWHLPRALMGGTRSMRAKGERYLPREQAEDHTSYKNRLNRSVLFNGFRKTVRDMTGKVFAKPIKIGEDMPEQLVAMAENVDLAGRSLNVFAFDVLKDALQVGVSFVLVDMLPAVEGETLADERRARRRPYFVHVPAERLIGWQSATINGVEQLTQVRIQEEGHVIDGPYHTRCVNRIRVVEPGRFELWEQVANSQEWVKVQEGPISINRVPLCPIYANRTAFMTGEPPLEDLADLNAAHWQLRSDLDNIVRVAQVPILFMSGVQKDDVPSLTIGASAMTTASTPNARLEYIEHSGRAIEAGRQHLKDLEFQMQAMGLELLLPRPGEQTATGRAIDQAAMNAPLQLMAKALEDALEQAFGYAGEFLGLGEDAAGSLTVNTDFGVSMRDATDLQTLLNAVNAGHISRARFLSELKRRGVLADDVDIELEMDAAENDGPGFGVIGARRRDDDEFADAAE